MTHEMTIDALKQSMGIARKAGEKGEELSEAQALREHLLDIVRELKFVGKGFDLQIILQTEWNMVDREIDLCSEENPWIFVLVNSLTDLERAIELLHKVRSLETYKDVNENHQIGSRRLQHLPLDEARNFYPQQLTRLHLQRLAMPSLEEDMILQERQKNLRKVHRGYVELQRIIMGVRGPRLERTGLRLL